MPGVHAVPFPPASVLESGVARFHLPAYSAPQAYDLLLLLALPAQLQVLMVAQPVHRDDVNDRDGLSKS